MSEGRRRANPGEMYWCRRFLNTGPVHQLTAAADVTLTLGESDEHTVTIDDDTVSVHLHYNESESHFIRVYGVFSLTDDTLQWAELEDGVLAGPLSGHGTCWRYHNGEVRKSTWIS